MDLEQFVASALTQITKGIISAQDQTLETGVVINPTTQYGNPVHSSITRGQGIKGGNEIVQVVKFDLAVTVADASKANAGGGIQVLGMNLGGGVGTEASSTSQSQISFSIPVLWPLFDYSKARGTAKVAQEEQAAASSPQF